MGTPPHIEIIKKSLINRLRDYKFNDTSIEDCGTHLSIWTNITIAFYNEHVEAKCWLPTNEETITQELFIIEYDDSTNFPDLLVDKIVQWVNKRSAAALLEG